MMETRRALKSGGTARDLVAVAVDAGKSSQESLKWALEKLVSKGQIVILLHVRKKITTIPTPSGQKLPISQVPEEVASIFLQQRDKHTKEFFVPLRCICNRRRVQLKEVVLDDIDIPKAIVNYAKHQTVDKLVLGTSSKNALIRAFRIDVPAYVSKNAPDFCSIYVISKGKISYLRTAPHQYVYPAGRPDAIFETHVVGYARSEPDTYIYNESPGSSPLVDYARNDRLSRAGIHMGHSYQSTASCPTLSMASIDSQSDYSSRESFIAGKHQYCSWPNKPKSFAYSDGSMTSFESKASGGSYSSNGSSGSGYARLPPRSQQKGMSLLKEQEDALSQDALSQDDVDLEISRLRLQLKQSANLFEDTLIEDNKLRNQENGMIDMPEMEHRTEAFFEGQGANGFRCANPNKKKIRQSYFS